MAIVEGKFSPGLKAERSRKRYLFLSEIERIAPQVIRSLRRNVYLPYRSLLPIRDPYEGGRFDQLDELARQAFYKAHPDAKWSDYEHHWNWDALMMADALHYPELIPIREAIIKWSRRYSLDANWCRQIAAETLDSWDKTKWGKDPYLKANELEGYYSPPFHSNSKIELELIPTENFPRYYPFRYRTKEEYLKEVEAWARATTTASMPSQMKKTFLGSDDLVSKLIDAHIDAEIRLYRKIAERYCLYLDTYYGRRFQKMPAKPDEAKHIKWAVQAQVLGVPLSKIAINENLFNGRVPNTAYVSREVHAVLNTMVLKPNPKIAAGRPAKKRKPLAK